MQRKRYAKREKRCKEKEQRCKGRCKEMLRASRFKHDLFPQISSIFCNDFEFPSSARHPSPLDCIGEFSASLSTVRSFNDTGDIAEREKTGTKTRKPKTIKTTKNLRYPSNYQPNSSRTFLKLAPLATRAKSMIGTKQYKTKNWKEKQNKKNK